MIRVLPAASGGSLRSPCDRGNVVGDPTDRTRLRRDTSPPELGPLESLFPHFFTTGRRPAGRGEAFPDATFFATRGRAGEGVPCP